MADRDPGPLYVGVTGSVAAGKSTVGRVFETRGAVRIDADDLAREAVRPGTPAHARIVSTWGNEVIDEAGSLDRAALRRIVFADPGARRALEEVVHGEVARRRAARRAEIEASPPASGIVVEEIPLLYEAGLEGGFGRIVVVDAPRELRAARARAARGWDEATFDAVEASQLAAAGKRARADIVILNDGSREDLERRAGEVWSALEAAARERAGGGDVDAAEARA